MGDGPRPRASAVPYRCPWFGIAAQNCASPSREPEPRSRGWERGGRWGDGGAGGDARGHAPAVDSSNITATQATCTTPFATP